MVNCLRCGRKLTNPDSVARQYGPVCWDKKSGKHKTTKKVKRSKKPRYTYQDLRKWFRAEKIKLQEPIPECRCKECNCKITYVKRYEEMALPCNNYCCTHCPYAKIRKCPREELEGGLINEI